MQRFILLLCLSLWPIAAFSQSPSITLKACGHHDYEPWNWQSDNQIKGVCAAVIKTLFAKLAVEVDLTYIGPWKRCQSYIKSGQADINICSFMNEERKTYSEFIDTPMGFNENAVFVKKGREFAFNSWDDLIGKKVGMVLGVSVGEKFDDFLEKNTSIEKVASYKQNFSKLLLERIDFIPIGRFAGLAMLQHLAMQEEIVALPKPIVTGKLYISMSKKSPYLHLLPKVEALMQQDSYNQWVETLLSQYAAIYQRESQQQSLD